MKNPSIPLSSLPQKIQDLFAENSNDSQETEIVLRKIDDSTVELEVVYGFPVLTFEQLAEQLDREKTAPNSE